MKKTLLFLICIILLGTALRVYKLDTLPYGFFCDEADIGYTAYRIARTGYDGHGNFFPFPVVPGVNGGRNPFPVYFTIPFVVAMGLNEFAVRYANAVLGVISIILFYGIAKTFLRTRFALFGTLLCAVSPWLITFNRVGWEQTSWVCMTVVFLFFLFHERWISFYVTAAIALYTYHPSWLVTGLFVVIVSIGMMSRGYNVKRHIFGVCLFVTLCFPLLLSIQHGTALGRAKDVVGPINTADVIRKYFAHFEYPFLFESGDLSNTSYKITRHSIKGMGQLYLFQLPLIFVGMYITLFKKQWRGILVVVYFFLSPLADALAGTVTATRSFAEIIPLGLMSASGVEYLWQKIRDSHIRAFWSFQSVLFFCGSVGLYFFAYFIQYPMYSSDYWGWQYGPKEIISYFINHQYEYDELFMDVKGIMNAPETFLPFYTVDGNLGCANCFVGGAENLDAHKKQLFAIRPDKVVEYTGYELELLHTVYYPDGTVAYSIYKRS